MVNMAQTIMFKCKFDLNRYKSGWILKNQIDQDKFLNLIKMNQVNQEHISGQTKHIFSDNSFIVIKSNNNRLTFNL